MAISKDKDEMACDVEVLNKLQEDDYSRLTSSLFSATACDLHCGVPVRRSVSNFVYGGSTKPFKELFTTTGILYCNVLLSLSYRLRKVFRVLKNIPLQQEFERMHSEVLKMIPVSPRTKLSGYDASNLIKLLEEVATKENVKVDKAFHETA